MPQATCPHASASSNLMITLAHNPNLEAAGGPYKGQVLNDSVVKFSAAWILLRLSIFFILGVDRTTQTAGGFRPRMGGIIYAHAFCN